MRRCIVTSLVLIVLTSAGCQRATRYTPPSQQTETQGTTTPEPIDPLIGWMEDKGDDALPGSPMVFVAENTDPQSWQSFLDRAVVERPETILFGWPALRLPELVRVKVPRGLPDPTPLIPSANPLTLNKWKLGRQLFYNTNWLTADEKIACASCHRPDRAFTDGVVHDGMRTPTLVNVVYNTRQFVDGRVVYLEEVVQQSLDDELLPEHPAHFRHAWGGVVTRLQRDTRWHAPFKKVFGTYPNQDAVGKAMATYLRTLLAGDSIHDRAEAARRMRGESTLTTADYQTAVDGPFLTTLGEKAEAGPAIAKRLVQGHQLFETWCVRCHSGPEFTDHGYHNLGVGPVPEVQKHMSLGRFGTLPIGLKQREMLGAYATPTLRGLPRTWPYLHTGEKATLEDVVRFHAKGGGLFTIYLDAVYREQRAHQGPEDESLSTTEQSNIVLFLRALEGTPVHPDLRGLP